MPSRSPSPASRRSWKKEKDEPPVVEPVRLGTLDEEDQREQVDGVFGHQGGSDTVKYRSVGWISTSVVLMKSQIGLGILAMPATLRTLGLIPGIILILALGIITTWTDWVVGSFKLNHPQVYSLADAFMYGRWAGEFVGACYWIYMVMVSGSSFITISTALNAVSSHGTCTAVFVTVAAIVTFLVSSLRRLEEIRWVTWVGLASILTAIFVGMIATAVGGRPADAPQEGPLEIKIVLFGNPSFADAMNAISDILFGLGGTPAFLPIACEMRNIHHYKRSLLLCQSVVVSVFLMIGIIMYCYAGEYVSSPALGTPGVLIKRIAYGLALPGLLGTATIYTHLPAKFIFVRLLRNSHHLNHSTPRHWIVWFSCTASIVLIAFIIAASVPVFSGIVGLVGALIGSILVLHCEALMWLYDNSAPLKDKTRRTLRWSLMTAFQIFILVIASIILVGGTYGSILSIKDEYAALGGKPFTCENNSGTL
ncbi:hypothetical protein JCM8097_002819 [Rhodosporidiobolus ruineniae]